VQALTELYQLLDKLSEQLGLAKNELFVANLGGRPFLLPGVWLYSRCLLQAKIAVLQGWALWGRPFLPVHG